MVQCISVHLEQQCRKTNMSVFKLAFPAKACFKVVGMKIGEAIVFLVDPCY